MKELNLAFIDLETDSLNFDAQIIEIAAVLANQKDLNATEEWSAKIKFDLEKADSESLKINKYNPAEWGSAIELKPALEIFLQKVSGRVLVGHNLAFDWAKITRALFENNLKPTFYYQGYDTISLAYSKLKNDNRIIKFKLDELADYFGIDKGNTHRALDDVRTTYQLFKKLVQ